MVRFSDKEKKDIEEDAKKILDKFSKALQDIRSEELEVIRGDGVRTEGEGEEYNKDFRKIMLENAPEKEGDFLLAEKKSW